MPGMTMHLFIFGMGYTAGYLTSYLRREGWTVAGTRRTSDEDSVAFDDVGAVTSELARATHILSSIPPSKDGGDPVLEKYGEAVRSAPAKWVGYLSSTGVYGDVGGAWVDESAPIGSGRRKARSEADLAWQALRKDLHIFRLPGIYGPGRSVIERVLSGKARRINLPLQVFSRVHVDDIVGGILASFDKPSGIFNLSDDRPCAQNEVIEHACDLLGLPYPSLESLKDANLSPMAQGFYAENRRISNRKAKRLFGWKPRFADYKGGLNAIDRKLD